MKQYTPEEVLELRVRLKMSQKIMARALRVSMGTIQNWEKGRCRPTARALLDLAEIEKTLEG